MHFVDKSFKSVFWERLEVVEGGLSGCWSCLGVR